MPKDPAKNIDRYQMQGGELNEFEFQQNQEAIAQQDSENLENLIPGTPPEIKVPEVEHKVHEIVEKRAEAAKKTSRPRAATKKPSKKAPKKAGKKRPAAGNLGQPRHRTVFNEPPRERIRSAIKSDQHSALL